MKKISFGKRSIGNNNSVFIIAEAGVNHNGDINTAKQLIAKAKECGADCIKFQTFKAERVATSNAPKAEYQNRTTPADESQVNMLKKLELPEAAYPELIDLCRSLDISFLSTPYDIKDIDFLDEIGVPAFKVASGQAVEPIFLEHLAKKQKPVLLSTGMCTLAEVDEAVRVIRNAGNDEIIVLQCTTNYPSAIADCNLRAMVTMRQALDVLVGYSDHTQSLTAALVAAAHSACVIERHFTLDKNLPGPDHSCSSDPEEFAMLVRYIREVESCLGSPLKRPSDAELRNLKGMRRSIVASQSIKAGEQFTHDNLTLKRPGTGLMGNQFQLVIGRCAKIDISPDQILSLEWVE